MKYDLRVLTTSRGSFRKGAVSWSSLSRAFPCGRWLTVSKINPELTRSR